MFDKLKSLFRKEPKPASNADQQYSFRWYEPGPDNPFGIRILDVRSLTGTVVATTSDQRIAERYVALRSSDGRDLVSGSIPEACEVSCALRFPHNGATLSGIVFKADTMDVKWDIYIYDGIFYFARSWTGELMFKAPASITSDSIRISSISCKKTEAELAASHVFFLLGNHAMGRVLPHRVPRSTGAGEKDIALMSFSLFGNRACYATFDEITHISLEPKQG